MIVDAYAHCAQEKYLPFEQLEAAHSSAGVSGGILVQHMGQFDNSYLASIVAAAPGRYRAVCLVDTGEREAPRRLRALLDGEACGVPFLGARMTRHMIDERIECLDVVNAYGATLVMHAPEGIGCQADYICHLAQRFPRVRIYVPHLGWPVVGGSGLAEWRAAVRSLQEYSQVIIGLSAIYHFSRQKYPHADTWLYLQYIIATIGVDRTVWGSDFPLLLETESVGANLELFSRLLAGIRPRDREAILGGTAARCWGLPKPTGYN